MAHAATHEAAHAVVAEEQGFTVTSVEIFSDGSGRTSLAEDEEEFEGVPIVPLAGLTAEELAYGWAVIPGDAAYGHGLRRQAGHPDYQTAQRVAGHGFRRWLPATEVAVRRNGEAIDAVASALLENGRLTGEQVREICSRFRPQPMALTAGQKLNTVASNVLPATDELSTQPDRLSEELSTQSGPIQAENFTQSPTEPEVIEGELEPEPETETEAEALVQSEKLSEELSTQPEPAAGLSEVEAAPLPQPEPEVEAIEKTEDIPRLSTQPTVKLSTQSWASLSTQPRQFSVGALPVTGAEPEPKLSTQSNGLSEELSTQPEELSEDSNTQPGVSKVVNLADFRPQFVPASAAVYDKSLYKRSRVKPGQLIVRVDGYSIAEDEYGVCFLKVLGRKPDRTSADFTQYPYAGFFKWSVAEEMGMLIKEIPHGTGTKSGTGGRGRRRAGANA